MSKNVVENVGAKTKKRPRRKLPPFVVEKRGKWFVRKTVTVNETKTDPETGEQKLIKQKQIWRACEPQTAERAREILLSIDAELYFAVSGASRPVSNFAEVCDEFELAELQPAIYENGRLIAGRRSLVAPRIMVKVLKDYFGRREIGSISFGEIEKFKLERLKTPIVSKFKSRPRSLRSVNYELSFLRQIFNFAYRRRWLDRSPFADGREIINPASENRRFVAFTRDEESRALALCTGRLAHLKPVIVLIVDAGFRWGELAGATWGDYDRDQGFIEVVGYKNKNQIKRRVFVTERIKRTLDEWRAIQQKTTSSKIDKKKIIGFASVKNAWATIRGEIGRPDLHIHDLRHVFATRLYYDAKAELGLVSRALGHSSIKTTEIYVNAQSNDVRDAVRRLDELAGDEKP